MDEMPGQARHDECILYNLFGNICGIKESYYLCTKGDKSEICVVHSISVGESSFFSFIHGTSRQFFPTTPYLFHIICNVFVHHTRINDYVLIAAILASSQAFIVVNDVWNTYQVLIRYGNLATQFFTGIPMVFHDMAGGIIIKGVIVRLVNNDAQ